MKVAAWTEEQFLTWAANHEGRHEFDGQVQVAEFYEDVDFAENTVGG